MLSLDQASSPTMLPRSRSYTNMSRMQDMKLRLRHKHIFIVTGPAGCGKTTVAQYLANRYSLKYLEGDDYHPPSNVKKMSSGTPLTDTDRWDWLVSVREAAVDHLDSRITPGVVLTCSALKRKYRDVIRVACYNDQAVQVHFIYLSASEDLLMDRIQSRQNHFMKPAMVKSQLQSLEIPTRKERDVVSIDVSGSMETVNRAAVDAVSAVLVGDLEGSL